MAAGRSLRYFLIVALALSSCASSRMEATTYARDTSFTTRSAWQKELRKYHFIQIARVELDAGAEKKFDIQYKRQGTRLLRLDLFYPRMSKKSRPAILLIHGGGWKSGDRTMMHELGKALANQGFVTAAAEYRLSPEASYPAALYDLREAISWLRRHARNYQIDTGRIAVLGVSSGGHLASLMGTTNGKDGFNGDKLRIARSGYVNAVVNIDGILAFNHPESAEGEVAAEWLGGTRETAAGNWEEASPLAHASSETVPMLFINSQHARFHAGRDDLIKKAGDRPGFEIKTLADTPHTFWIFEPWFDEVVALVSDYLKRVLK